MKRAEVVRGYGGVSAAQRRAERRRRLIDAGRNAWGESGIAEVTVRGTCVAAGLTPRYFYENFANRDELIVAIAQEVQAELISILVTTGLSTPGGLEQKLFAALRAFFDAIADDPHIHRIAASEAGGVSGLTEQRAASLDTLTALVLEHGPALVGATLTSGEELRRAALFIVGGVNRVVDDWLHASGDTSTDQLAKLCTGLCLAVVNGGKERGGPTPPA